MKEIKTLLEQSLNIDFLGATLSNPKDKNGIIKVKVRPILKQGTLYFHCESHKNNQVFHENLEANQIPEEKFGVIQGNIIDEKDVQDAAGYECYDIAVANILADIIIMIQEEVPVHIKKGGIFITSGIINMKEQAVKDALAKNDAFEIIETTYQGEWVSITCRKK